VVKKVSVWGHQVEEGESMAQQQAQKQMRKQLLGKI